MTSLLENMGLPAVAGGLAVCISHPLELTKVRLQLDNELAASGTKRRYGGWIDCVLQTWRSDGIRGLQRGLPLGIVREVCFNAVRIGLYEPVLTVIRSAFGRGEIAPTVQERMAAGFVCGALGGCCVNPIEVLKVRMQAQGGLTGHQHGIANPVDGLNNLLREEGIAGCFRGVATSTMRGILGPGSQLIAYNEIKTTAVTCGADASAIITHVCCALTSAIISVAIVNPVDVVRTRIYNAPKDRLYASGIDAAQQLVRSEGVLAFYKGSLTHFLRLGPHMVLVFGILEQLKKICSS